MENVSDGSKRDDGGRDVTTRKILQRFSSVKLSMEKDRRRTISRYQQKGLEVNPVCQSTAQDKKEIRKQLRASLERYSLPELYVKMICALFPQLKSREIPDSPALIKHLKLVFRLTDQEHNRLIDVARMTKLPQRIINLEIVEAKEIPAKDPNGLSDPFCVVYVNSRDMAQRTKVVPMSLNPIWKQYFTLYDIFLENYKYICKVNDPTKDVLHIEVMDYNEQNQPLGDRIRRFRGKSSNLGSLIREIANTRSIQELIGSLRIPVSDISSETLEKWFKIKNNEDKGEIYLRMALGYNKSREAATEEFLQIIHFLIIHELDRDSALGAPYHWDENYEVWSKYILRQFKWQGALKPKDIVLAKWRAYTTVNGIFPLSANMMCLLLDAVLSRALNNEYDARELNRFWDCMVRLMDSIITFLSNIHDVLPCPVTVLHSYHMLKTIELLNQFLQQASTADKAKIPFTKSDILGRVNNAIRDGANKFYLKVFADSTGGQINSNEDPLNLALERLLKMAQILHEDIRLGVSTVNTDFKRILNVDYLTITYQVYDEQFGKMVKYIVEEYNSNLMDYSDSESVNEYSLDENSTYVKAGLTVLKLYLAVKSLSELVTQAQAPPHYLDLTTSEFSLKRGIHDWFFHSVATWIDTLRRRVINLVKNSVTISEGSQALSQQESILNKVDKQSARDVPISASALDTAQLFMEINRFWTSLGWDNPHQSYLIVRKILEELHGALIYYANQLLNAHKAQRIPYENQSDNAAIQPYLRMGCIEINNINYVKEHVDLLADQLDIPTIIYQIELTEASSQDNGEYEENINAMKVNLMVQIEKVIDGIIHNCIKTMLPKLKQLLLELSNLPLVENTSSSSFKPVLHFIDDCLLTIKENLELTNFELLLGKFWMAVIEEINGQVDSGLENIKPREHYERCKNLLDHLYSLFWPKDVNLEARINSPVLFEEFEELKARLSYLNLSVEDLKFQYYEQRYKRQQSISKTNNEHGIITIRIGFVETQSSLVVELLNARKLKSYDKNDLSDPYAMVELVPSGLFPVTRFPTNKTKVHKETLYPLFEETFTYMVKDDERKKGFLKITIFDYDLIGSDEFMGEVFYPLTDITKLSSTGDIDGLPQLHLPLSKPDDSDSEYLQKFEKRVWDKEAVHFAKREWRQ